MNGFLNGLLTATIFFPKTSFTDRWASSLSVSALMGSSFWNVRGAGCEDEGVSVENDGGDGIEDEGVSVENDGGAGIEEVVDVDAEPMVIAVDGRAVVEIDGFMSGGGFDTAGSVKRPLPSLADGVIFRFFLDIGSSSSSAVVDVARVLELAAISLCTRRNL